MAGLFALTASALPASAHSGAGLEVAAYKSGKSGAGSSCTKAERLSALALEQERVLKLVGKHRVLNSQADLDQLGEFNPETNTQFGFLSHMFVSMKDNGVAVVNVGEVGPGKPAFLTYRPNPHAKDVLDPFGPDFPYVLVGWGYVTPYVPGEAPSFPDDPGLRCLNDSEWFVHERSVHPADTWQNIAVPPEEDYLGQVAGERPPTAEECQCEVAIPHGRFWDIHIWLRGVSPFPTVSMLKPGRPIPGFDPVVGFGFFYPETPPEAAADVSLDRGGPRQPLQMGYGHATHGHHGHHHHDHSGGSR